MDQSGEERAAGRERVPARCQHDTAHPGTVSVAAPMILLRALAIWLLLMSAEVMHGTLRTLLLEPRLGDLRARQVGVVTGSLLILGLACPSVRWIGARSARGRALIGGMWLVLTLLFEVGFGRLVLGRTWERLASDYDVSRGGLLPFGLVVLALAPWVAGRIRGI